MPKLWILFVLLLLSKVSAAQEEYNLGIALDSSSKLINYWSLNNITIELKSDLYSHPFLESKSPNDAYAAISDDLFIRNWAKTGEKEIIASYKALKDTILQIFLSSPNHAFKTEQLRESSIRASALNSNQQAFYVTLSFSKEFKLEKPENSPILVTVLKFNLKKGDILYYTGRCKNKITPDFYTEEATYEIYLQEAYEAYHTKNIGVTGKISSILNNFYNTQNWSLAYHKPNDFFYLSPFNQNLISNDNYIYYNNIIPHYYIENKTQHDILFSQKELNYFSAFSIWKCYLISGNKQILNQLYLSKNHFLNHKNDTINLSRIYLLENLFVFEKVAKIKKDSILLIKCQTQKNKLLQDLQLDSTLNSRDVADMFLNLISPLENTNYKTAKKFNLKNNNSSLLIHENLLCKMNLKSLNKYYKENLKNIENYRYPSHHIFAANLSQCILDVDPYANNYALRFANPSLPSFSIRNVKIRNSTYDILLKDKTYSLYKDYEKLISIKGKSFIISNFTHQSNSINFYIKTLSPVLVSSQNSENIKVKKGIWKVTLTENSNTIESVL